ncbi:3650_t:CDS:2, partial [Dentiscutata heterogama]
MQSKLSALSTDDSSYIQDVNSSSNKYQVTIFVREVLRRVIPEEFWGCNDNQQIIFEDIWLRIEKYNMESLPANTFEEVPK